MLRKIGMLHKMGNVLKARNFSARMKLSKIEKSSQVVLDNQVLGAKTQESTHAKVATTKKRYENEEFDVAAATESALMDSKGIFRETEGEAEKVYNYVETEQTLRNDIQMINYKSKIYINFDCMAQKLLQSSYAYFD